MPETPGLSPGQGGQSEHDLHTYESFGKFVDCVSAASRDVLKELDVGLDSLDITGGESAAVSMRCSGSSPNRQANHCGE